MSADQIALLERRLKREKSARKQAENLLETKSLELYNANNKLQDLAYSQEDKIRTRTKELKIARDKALKASEAKGNFLATMSHEIRTPMNGIIGMAQILLETELSSKQKTQLSVLLSSSESLLQIINDILDLSKLEYGNLLIQKVQFNIYELIDDILSSLSITSSQKNLEIINIIDSNVPFELVGDPSRLRQILINLVGNAIKFTDSGHIQINLEVIEKQHDSNTDEMYIQFEVTDTGKGISNEDQDKLFKPFSQITGTKYDKEIQKGTGLGLSICKKLSKIMNGTIELRSENKVGTTFTLCIPFKSVNQTKTISKSSKKVCFYQNAAELNKLTHKQFDHLSEAVTKANNIQEVIRFSEKNTDDANLIFIDSEYLTIENQKELCAYLHANRINKNQWIFIQSINETNLQLSNYCEDNHLHTLIKPLSQRKLAELILPEQFKNNDDTIKENKETTFNNKHILLAEDNKVNQMVAKALLEKQGLKVTIANDGIEALALFDKHQHDLVLMDINMPRMGGLEALHKLREILDEDLDTSLEKNDKNSDKSSHNISHNISHMNENKKKHFVPVVALTANAIQGSAEEYIKAGMDGYLSKPIEVDKLVNELEKWL